MELAASLNRAGTAEAPPDVRIVGKPFAKGRSGNPAGRPRKPKAMAEVRKILRGSIHEMVRAAAFAPVRVEIDGELAEITALEAGMREVAMQAARGDRLALLALTRLLAATADEVAVADPAPVEPAAAVITPEIEIAESYKQGWSVVAECNRRLREALPLPLPHPDTIEIDRAKGEVRFTAGQPTEPLSLEGLIALYRELHEGLRARIEELRLPRDRRPKPTQEWSKIDSLIERLERWLPAQHHLPPPLPRIDRSGMDLADMLEAGYQRSLLFNDGFPEANAAAEQADEEPARGAAEFKPAPAPAEADPPPAPESEETAACRDIRTRALAAAGGTGVPQPEDDSTIAGLRCWLATLNREWDRLEYDWACTRLQTVRDALERRQQQVGRARTVVEQGLAAWDREHPPEADAAEAPPSWDRAEAEAYVRIWRRAMEGTEGSFFNLRTPRPSPHLVVIAGGGADCHGELAPGDSPTIANLRRWPARLAEIEAELAADLRAERDPGVLVQLRSRRRMAERARTVVEEGLAEWEAAASLPRTRQGDPRGSHDQREPGGGAAAGHDIRASAPAARADRKRREIG